MRNSFQDNNVNSLSFSNVLTQNFWGVSVEKKKVDKLDPLDHVYRGVDLHCVQWLQSLLGHHAVHRAGEIRTE